MYHSTTAAVDKRDDVEIGVRKGSATVEPYVAVRLGDSLSVLFTNKDALSALIEQASDALTAWIDA